MPDTNSGYLALGTNVGDRVSNLSAALQMLEADGIELDAQSSVYETAPRDFVDQPWFLNMAVRVKTSLDPEQVLSILHKIERQLGRDRASAPAQGPRTIDIDILLWGETQLHTDRLTIPHPRMLERRFVLEPLTEIDPGLIHPQTGRPLAEYLAATQDQLVRRFNPHSQDPAVP